MHRSFIASVGLVLILLSTIAVCAPGAVAQTVAPLAAPGDRVLSAVRNLDEWIPATLSREGYRIAPGDTLGVYIQGRATLKYVVHPDSGTDESPNELTVSPSGDIFIPLAGKIPAAGKTVPELESSIQTALGKYIRSFTTSVSVSKVRTVNIWISGEVDNPGPHIVPGVSGASLAVLQAGIKPTGSTRRITLTRQGAKHTIDLYRMSVTGAVDGDMPLEPGDSIHVPPVTDYVEVKGEVTRPGRYEMIGLSGSGAFGPQNLVRLSLGATPAAALDRMFIERIGEGGLRSAVAVDLSEGSTPAGEAAAMKAGDVLVVPSIEAFQPMIRVIGEFKGEGIYQRTPGITANDMENKSGIYFLKRGQTVLDVISATGGVTPQADLKRAHIERREGGVTRTIPLDLEALLVNNDKSADQALVNGDSLVLPATDDRVHIFGDVRRPGSFPYSPMRRLVDYLGDAGGPTERARLSEVSVVRGPLGSPQITRFNAERAIRGGSTDGNPELMPGDIVFVPQKFISNWRDGMQLLFSALSLGNLLSK